LSEVSPDCTYEVAEICAGDAPLSRTRTSAVCYARNIELLLLLAFVIGVAWVLVAVLGLGRMAWRILRHNEEMQSGGSMGRQMFGRTKEKKPKRKRARE